MMRTLLLIALGLLPFGIGILSRVTERSWVAPSTFWAFIWGAVSLPAAVVFPDTPGIDAALLWIFLACLMVWLGALAAHPFTAWGGEPRPQLSAIRTQLPGLRLAVLISIAAGVGELLLQFSRQGFSLRSILSYAALAQISAANRSDYLGGEIQQGLAERIAFLCLYAGTLFGGSLFRLSRGRWERILCVLPLLLLLITFGLYGSRMGVLYGGSFWVGAYLATSILVGNWRDIIGWQFLVRVGLIAGGLGFGVSVGTMVWRYSLYYDTLNWQKMLGDGVSFVAAFGIWFKDHQVQVSDFLWGGRLLRKLVAPLGIDIPIALEINVGFTSSNIFTILRDLIEDFGTVGALLFLFLYGMAGRTIFSRLTRGQVRSLGALTLVYAFALTGIAFSIFSYTVTGAAILGFIGYTAVAPTLARWQSDGSIWTQGAAGSPDPNPG